MKELIEELSKINTKDIENLIELYNELPEGIIKDSIEVGLIHYKKLIGRIKDERNTQPYNNI